MGLQLKRIKNSNRDPLALIIFAFIILGSVFTVTSFVLVRDVLIIDDGAQVHIHTYAHKAGDVLKAAGLTLHSQDQVSPGIEESLPRRGVIEITRAYPVFVRVDGQEFDCWVTGGRVADILKDRGIALRQMDIIKPALTQEALPHMFIEVTRVFKQTIEEQVVMSFREVRQPNPSMDKGFSRVVKRGSDGLREDIIEITYADGIQVEKELLESRILRARQDRIVEEGTNTLLAARGGQTIRFSRAMYVTATAYCPGTAESDCPINEHGHSACTGKHNTGYTATGVKAVAGSGNAADPHLIAVDPRLIPLGSRVYIAGYGFAHAQDTGGSIKGARIDLLFSTHSAALRFGRRQLKIYLLP